MAVAVVEGTWSAQDEGDIDLVAAARAGDQGAWEEIVRRFAPLVAGIARRHRLSGADTADICQQTWVALVEHAPQLRNSRALPGWIATTAHRACWELLRRRRRAVCVDPTGTEGMDRPLRLVGRVSEDPIDAGLLQAERAAAVRDGLASLEVHHRELLLLLVADPPVPYAQISERTGLPVGSIGPTRARLLAKLRRSSAVSQLFDPGTPAA